MGWDYVSWERSTSGWRSSGWRSPRSIRAQRRFGHRQEFLGAYLVNIWCGGRAAYTTPGRIAGFAALSFLPTGLSATIGVVTLALAGFAEWSNFGPIWFTWWLGDLAGALVITPVVVLWASNGRAAIAGHDWGDSIALFAGTCAIGVIVFSPLIEQSAHRAPLAFLAVLPLVWSALRHGQRDTATVAVILSGFAVWGTLAGGGPFPPDMLNERFLLLLMFMISMAVPSLALAA